jgi:CubicO group peptidase (beta-lactamase class C family)
VNIRIAAAFLLLGAAGLVVAAQAPPESDEVDRYVLSEMKRQQIPGLSLAVVKDGKLVKARGYGLANVEHDVAATERTIYQSGSVGKQFTAAGILLLAEDGKLSLDDRITKYFPGAPAAWGDITIRRLLTHTSGIKNYTDGALDMRRDYKDDELAALAMKPPLDFAPGTKWSYSNTGYVLLGVIMTKVSGKFYGDFLAERVFTPLGMTTARIINEADIVRNRAAGYRLVKGILKNQDWVSPSLNTTADGSLYLTVLDMAKWEAALEGTSFLSPASRRAWWTPVALSGSGSYPYGMGWSLEYERGHRSIGHGGAWQGFKTHIQRYPDDGLAVIVLTNLSQARQSAIAYGVAGLYNPALTPPHVLNEATGDSSGAALVARLMAAIATEDTSVFSPGFASVLTSEDRKQMVTMLKAAQRPVFVGCDSAAASNVERYGAVVDRYCSVKMPLVSGGRAITFWITKDDRLAGFTAYAY